jgi:CRP-like cAMP-binding protein
MFSDGDIDPSREEVVAMPILEQSGVLEKLSEFPILVFEEGDVVLAAGSMTGRLLFLRRGAVEVVRDDVCITRVAEPGAVFGELALLLGQPHSADVLAVVPSSFYVVDDAAAFLKTDPLVGLYVAMVLAGRLDAVNRHLLEARTRIAAASDEHGFFVEILDRIGRTLQFRGSG